MTGELTVIAVTATDDNIRGLLTKWLVEPMPGLYCGALSKRVREQLWDALQDNIPIMNAYACMITRKGHALAIRTAGERARAPVDLDGITLIAWSYRDPFEPAPPTTDSVTEW